MKNLFLGLVFALFAFQVNAATVTSGAVTLSDPGTGDYIALFDAGPSSVQGIALVSGLSWTRTWNVDVDPSTGIRNVTVENDDLAVNISSVKLVDDNNASIFWDGNFDGSGEWNLSAYLYSTTSYTLTVIGDVIAPSISGSITTTVSAVPLPAAVWLFGSALMGLVGVSRRKSTALAA